MKTILTLLLVFIGVTLWSQSGWINEIHYDNTGVDVNEFVEVVLPAGQDLSLYSVDFYNGKNQEIYKSVLLRDFAIGDTVDIYTIYYHLTSLQNGPDGLALVYDGNIVDDIAYEGLFDPLTFLLPLSESGNTDEAASLQLQGDSFEDYEWIDDEATPGYININQSIEAPIIDTSFNLPEFLCSHYGHTWDPISIVFDTMNDKYHSHMGYRPCINYWVTYTEFHWEQRICMVCLKDSLFRFDHKVDSIFIYQFSCDTSSYINWPENYNIPPEEYNDWPNQTWYQKGIF